MNERWDKNAKNKTKKKAIREKKREGISERESRVKVRTISEARGEEWKN